MPRQRSRSVAFRTLLAASVGAALACVLSNATAQSLREKWNQPTDPFHVIGNVHYVGTAGLAVYLIATPRGHFLLDGGLAESVPLITKNIETLGFKLGDIKYLLNSHAHYDHSGGLAELKRLTGAKLIASALDKGALESGSYLGSEAEHALDSVPVTVDRTVRDHEKLSLGGTTLTANLTPGHTRGCTSWSMTVEEKTARYKLLFFCSTSVAANRLVGPPQYPGIVADYERTFARAKRMQVDVFLAPHPEFFGLSAKREQIDKSAQNPFVDPNEFRAFIEKSEADFHAQLDAQKAKSLK